MNSDQVQFSQLSADTNENTALQTQYKGSFGTFWWRTFTTAKQWRPNSCSSGWEFSNTDLINLLYLPAQLCYIETASYHCPSVITMISTTDVLQGILLNVIYSEVILFLGQGFWTLVPLTLIVGRAAVLHTAQCIASWSPSCKCQQQPASWHAIMSSGMARSLL
jgi:hypothetical protein